MSDKKYEGVVRIEVNEQTGVPVLALQTDYTLWSACVGHNAEDGSEIKGIYVSDISHPNAKELLFASGSSCLCGFGINSNKYVPAVMALMFNDRQSLLHLKEVVDFLVENWSRSESDIVAEFGIKPDNQSTH